MLFHKKSAPSAHPDGMDAAAVTWRQYESGKNYNRRIGLYATVRENERFVRGDQWKGVDAAGLPTPVINLVGRIASYLVSAITSYRMSVAYKDDSIAFLPKGKTRKEQTERLELLNRFLSDRFTAFRGSAAMRDAVQDAVISGDGVFYSYWDEGVSTGQPFRGELKTVTVDSVNFFVSDTANADLQAQDYLIIAGRAPVEALRREARLHGAKEETVRAILPDTEWQDQSSEYAEIENDDPDAGKTTFLLKFTRDENGYVCFEKSVRGAVIRRESTTLRRYPVAAFRWERTKGSYHGASPITQLVPNQKYVNKAYAMAMKHMADTAFSKVIYDKRLIPEWSNEVGEAIGVVSGGDIRSAAATIGVGEMQSDYLALIEQTIRETKEMAGATDVALGQVDPTNTSAIIALREAAEQPLDGVRASLCCCIEELAENWLELYREYCGGNRFYPAEKEPAAIRFDLLGDGIHAHADMGSSGRYSKATLVSLLDGLLRDGHITFPQYLERLPEGLLPDKELLLSEARSANHARKEVSEDGNEPKRKAKGSTGFDAVRSDPFGKRTL